MSTRDSLGVRTIRASWTTSVSSAIPTSITLAASFALAAAVASCGAVPESRPGPASLGPDEMPRVVIRAAPLIEFPGANNPDRDRLGETDSNSPAHWSADTLYVLNSAGHPWRSSGPDVAHLDGPYGKVTFDNEVSGGRWFECTWRDDGGTLYGWYHNEPAGVCPGAESGRHLTAPRIGAARSLDDGATWEDLGIVLDAPADSLRCDTENFYFAGGNGDFSAIPDAGREYIYFFISTYGKIEEQGVAAARMRYADRVAPAGKVWKWHRGEWKEPGLGGRLTPIFPAAIDWHRKDADAFWGPSVHYNTHLGLWVILLNRAVDSDWKQEGIYVTFNRDVADPSGWTPPRKILDRAELLENLRTKSAWYPQVIGTDAAARETDKRAGKTARLFVHGESLWEIAFLRPGES